MVNKRLFKNKLSKVSNILSFVIIIVTIFGRLISGVHWFTDILGGFFIALALLMTFYSILQKFDNEKN
jgi:undecaprenyl-diphosphatase